MPKRKPDKGGRRINIWVPENQLPVVDDIENLSRFMQICLTQAADIMTFAILHDIDPVKYHLRAKLPEIIDEFNEKNPLDPLTQKRLGKPCRINSPKLPDALL